MQEDGWQNFKVELLETIPIDQLDEKEKYWIKKLDTRANGYNIAPGGKDCVHTDWPRVQVAENGLVFDSREEAKRLFTQTTSWSELFLSGHLRSAVQDGKDFLGYHFEEVSPDTTPSDTDVLIDWIKTLNIRYTGKHIYCNELDKEFETIAAAAQYLLENNLYQTRSKTPIQSLVTSIGYNIHGKTNHINGTNGVTYTFEEIPGTTKLEGTTQSFTKNKIYCPQLDKTFDSQTEAARYLVENNIWTNIKVKTAALRISDIIRGAFPDFRGYTFQKV